MKKSNFVAGVVYVLAGIGFLLAGLLTNTNVDALLFGFAGACMGPGCVMLFRYFYWSSSKHKKEYHEKLEKEQIELHDELKEKLRDKAGRYAYVLGLIVVGVSIPAFGVLNKLQLVDVSNVLIIFLFIYFIFQYVAGAAIFKMLLKKYE